MAPVPLEGAAGAAVPREGAAGAAGGVYSDDDANATTGAAHKLSELTTWLCGTGSADNPSHGNTAGYGPCIATPYRSPLDIRGMPTFSSPGHAGLDFEVEVLKKDTYGQVIATDTSSGVQIFSGKDGEKVRDQSITLLGTQSVFKQGRATFSVAVKPTFANINVDEGVATLLRQPLIYVEGLDTESTSESMMQSNVVEVHLAQGQAVCPNGYVLSFENATSGAGVAECVACAPQTFSLNPFANDGFCLTCTGMGLTCNGGSQVEPMEGFWLSPHLVLENPEGKDMFDRDVASVDNQRSGTEEDFKAVRCPPGACFQEWKCKEGHRGRLCGLCKETSIDGRRYAMGSDGCVECKESSQAVAWVIMTVSILVTAILYYVAVWRPWIKSDQLESAVTSCIGAIRNAASSAREAVMKCVCKKRAGKEQKRESSLMGYLKVAVGFFQVTSSFLSNLEVDFSDSLRSLMSVSRDVILVC